MLYNYMLYIEQSDNQMVNRTILVLYTRKCYLFYSQIFYSIMYIFSQFQFLMQCFITCGLLAILLNDYHMIKTENCRMIIYF